VEVFAAAQSAATKPNNKQPPQCGVNKELNMMKPLGYHHNTNAMSVTRMENKRKIDRP
jgi:hypothetical protein